MQVILSDAKSFRNLVVTREVVGNKRLYVACLKVEFWEKCVGFFKFGKIRRKFRLQVKLCIGVKP